MYNQQCPSTEGNRMSIWFVNIRQHLSSVELEKAFDDVPREVIRWAMSKFGFEEWLV